jgi:hypothetical protein
MIVVVVVVSRTLQIICQQDNNNDLFRVDLNLFNYSPNELKSIDMYDCDVHVDLAKMNVVFLYKHVDGLLVNRSNGTFSSLITSVLVQTFLDLLNMSKTAQDLASSQAGAALEQVQKLHEQAFKVQLDVTFNAPNIIVPVNSTCDQALLLDLGRLTLRTSFADDEHKLLVERQTIDLGTMLASRVKLDDDNAIVGEVILIECIDMSCRIDRLLYPNKVKNEPGLSVQLDWQSIDVE